MEDRTSPPALAELAAELAELRAAQPARHLRDTAVGVLVARLGLEPAAAAEHLEALAESAGLPVAELAADIVDQAAGAGDTPANAQVNPGADADRSGGPGPGPEAGAADRLAPGSAGARERRRALAAAESAPDLTELAHLLLGEGLAGYGVRGLLLWQRTDTDVLELVAAAGVNSFEAARWRAVPPQFPSLLGEAVRTGAPLWLPDGPEPPAVLPGPVPEAGRAVLPLRARGSTVGVAVLVWGKPGQPPGVPADPSDRTTVAGLVEVAARLLEDAPRLAAAERPVVAAVLDLLAHPAMMLHRDPGTGRLRVEHLNTAAARVGAPLTGPAGRPLDQLFPYPAGELDTMAAEAERTGAPQRAARVPSVHRQETPGPLLNVRVLPVGEARTVALWHVSSRDHGFSLLQSAGRLGGLAAFEDDLTRGTAQWTEQAFDLLGMDRDATPLPLDQLRELLEPASRPEIDTLLRSLTQRQESSAAVVRLPRPDGGVRHLRIVAEPLLTHGTLTGLTGVFQDVSALHHTEVALAATFDQLTTVREQSAVRHELALRLQQAILPELPAFAPESGIQVAGRYRPAAQVYRVGGDWYDVLEMPDGTVLVAVGDVAGHGIEASTGMVALRNALRGLAFTGTSPGRLMHWLNEVALHTAGRPTATAVCAQYDPRARTLRWTSAGHLPPLLLRDGRAQLLDDSHNLLLGAVAEVQYTETVTQLRPGDRLLLYTDGLIERRHASLDQTLARLRADAGRLVQTGLEEQADELMAHTTGDTDDDASLILIDVR